MRVIAALALATLALLPVAAQAASRSTVLVTGNTPLRSGPGNGYNIIGTLRDGSRFHLSECTRNSNWCKIVADGHEIGWARGSFLLGWSAKIQVTTPESVLPNPFGRHAFP